MNDSDSLSGYHHLHRQDRQLGGHHHPLLLENNNSDISVILEKFEGRNMLLSKVFELYLFLIILVYYTVKVPDLEHLTLLGTIPKQDESGL